MITAGDTSAIRWRMLDLSSSHEFERVVAAIEARVAREEQRESLFRCLAIVALVEMSQRSASQRLGERLVSLSLRLVGLKRRLTLGPFQIQDAPVSLDAAADMAVRFLMLNGYEPSRAPATIDSVTWLADVWNGSSQPTAGSMVSYKSALMIADETLALKYGRIRSAYSNLQSASNANVSLAVMGGCTDDLPWRHTLPAGTPSPIGMFSCECTDFVLWRLNRAVDALQGEWKFDNRRMLLGNAENWLSAWLRLGWPIGYAPRQGSVAWFSSGQQGYGALGHVAWVTELRCRQIFIEEYVGLAYRNKWLSEQAPAIYLYVPEEMSVLS